MAQAAVWGLLGGFIVEALELLVASRRVGGWPWTRPGEPGVAPMVVSVVLRMAIGAILAAAAYGSGQVGGPLPALGLGVAAPLVIEKMTRTLSGGGTDAS